MIAKRTFILGLLFLLNFWACENSAPKITSAFYHWQTRVELTATEQSYLQNSKKLYVKFFDVDWDGAFQEAVPQAQVEWSTALPDSLDIIPTVFITNRTLLNSSEEFLPELAEKIVLKIEQLQDNYTFQEVQFDCDWTSKTQGKYFELLRLLRSGFPRKTVLSATIRLHQIQYAQRTGVPPVDRGMLMFYNMGDLESWETENSILDIEIGRSYLSKLEDYPLPLDVALPIFQWGIVFRENRLLQLINNLQPSDLQDTSRFLQLSPQRYQAKKSTYLDGSYVYAGDRIRLESIALEQLKTAAQVLSEQLRQEPRTVAFYHLDTATIKNYPYATLDSIVSIFR